MEQPLRGHTSHACSTLTAHHKPGMSTLNLCLPFAGGAFYSNILWSNIQRCCGNARRKPCAAFVHHQQRLGIHRHQRQRHLVYLGGVPLVLFPDFRLNSTSEVSERFYQSNAWLAAATICGGGFIMYSRGEGPRTESVCSASLDQVSTATQYDGSSSSTWTWWGSTAALSPASQPMYSCCPGHCAINAWSSSLGLCITCSA
eukprot:363141-Chlamydomonas_euryale.AAC.10